MPLLHQVGDDSPEGQQTLVDVAGFSAGVKNQTWKLFQVYHKPGSAVLGSRLPNVLCSCQVHEVQLANPQHLDNRS